VSAPAAFHEAHTKRNTVIERPQQYQKRPPPIYETPTTARHSRPLHAFTAMPPSVVAILGARRIPAVPAPMGNTNSAVSIFTSTGFQVLSTDEYHQAVDTLRPDIAIPLADLSHGPVTPTSKRAVRMAERTDEWLKAWFTQVDSSAQGIATFAPVTPVSYPLQWEYLERLAEDLAPEGLIDGLAIYDPDLLPDLLDAYPTLVPLPRLAVSAPPTPHHVLHALSLGADAFVLPFINAASDAGVALTFAFPPSDTTSPANHEPGTSTLPIGVDLSSPTYKFSAAPLFPSCTCHTCARHSAAYVHHLLSAREMLGWTLLQIHNDAVVSSFFSGIRTALAQGAEVFEAAARRFAKAYDPELPAGTGDKPRARGYQFKSGGGEKKINKPGWAKFDGGGEGQKGKGGNIQGDGTLQSGEEEPSRHGASEAEPGLDDSTRESPLVPGEVGREAKDLDMLGLAETDRIEETKKETAA